MKHRPMRALAFALLSLFALASGAAQPNQNPSTLPPIAPKEARRAFEKAAAALKAKHPDEAILDYEQAVTLFPAFAEAWYELGKLRRDHRQPDAARSAFESAIHADPKYANAYMALAALENDAKRWKQLAAITDELLRIDAIDFPQAWLLNSLGNYNNRNFAAAEKSAREAERMDTGRKFPETWRLLGLILAQRGDFAGATDQFQQYLSAVPSGPDSEAIRARLAEAAKAAGNAAETASGPAFRTETTLAVVRFQLRQNKGQPARTLLPEDI
jgi:Tfp pilus assembly protein PilF